MTHDEKNTQAQEPEPMLIPDEETPIVPEGYIPLEELPTPLLSAGDDRWIIRAYGKAEATEGMLIFEDEQEIAFLIADECEALLDRLLAQYWLLLACMSEECKSNAERHSRIDAATWMYHTQAYDPAKAQFPKYPEPDAIAGPCDQCGKDAQLFQMFEKGKGQWLCGGCLKTLRGGQA